MYKHVNSNKCAICDMTCSSPSGLATHIRYKHIKERPFNCLHCDFKAVTKTDLNKHIAVKHDKIKYTCTEMSCGFTCRYLITIQKVYIIKFIYFYKFSRNN